MWSRADVRDLLREGTQGWWLPGAVLFLVGIVLHLIGSHCLKEEWIGSVLRDLGSLLAAVIAVSFVYERFVRKKEQRLFNLNMVDILQAHCSRGRAEIASLQGALMPVLSWLRSARAKFGEQRLLDERYASSHIEAVELSAVALISTIDEDAHGLRKCASHLLGLLEGIERPVPSYHSQDQEKCLEALRAVFEKCSRSAQTMNERIAQFRGRQKDWIVSASCGQAQLWVKEAIRDLDRALHDFEEQIKQEMSKQGLCVPEDRDD